MAYKPADQAYSSAKTYQDFVSTRLHDTLLASLQTLGSLQAKLGAAATHVPKSAEDLQQAAHNLHEQLEAVKNAYIKQRHDLVSSTAMH